ncbi:hypothetical protein D3C77_576000 [compost metagenome]
MRSSNSSDSMPGLSEVAPVTRFTTIGRCAQLHELRAESAVPGLLFLGMPCPGSWHTADLGSKPHVTSEESDNAILQADHVTDLALLRGVARIEVRKTKSLCYIAAGIIPPASAYKKVLIPHERLRRPAPADTPLIASDRPHAQPAKGYKDKNAPDRRGIHE